MKRAALLFVCVSACAHPSEVGLDVVRDAVAARVGVRPLWPSSPAEWRLAEEAARELLAEPLDLEHATKLAFLRAPNLQRAYAEFEARRATSRADDLDARAAEDELVDFVTATVARVRVAFVEAQSARDVAAEQRRRTATFEVGLATATSSARRGELGESEVLRLTAELEGARLDELRATAGARAALERLRAQLGLWDADPPLRMNAELRGIPSDEVALDGLVTRAVGERRDLASAKKRSELAAIRLERAENGLGGDATARAAAFRATQHDVTAQAIAVRSEVRALRDELVAERRRAVHLRDVVLPLVERVARASTASLHDRAAVHAARLDLIQATTAYWRTRFRLERAVGGALR